jgi:hypothetical protein
VRIEFVVEEKQKVVEWRELDGLKVPSPAAYSFPNRVIRHIRHGILGRQNPSNPNSYYNPFELTTIHLSQPPR